MKKYILKTILIMVTFGFISCKNSENERYKNQLHIHELDISEIEKSNLEIDKEILKINQEMDEKTELANKLQSIYEDEIQPKLFRTQEEKDYELAKIRQSYNNTTTYIDTLNFKIKELQKTQNENIEKITDLRNEIEFLI